MCQSTSVLKLYGRNDTLSETNAYYNNIMCEMESNYFGIVTVVHLDVRKLESFDVDRMRENLKSLGYRGTEPFMNDFGFCPHIICAIDDNGELFVDNTNSGNYSSHTRRNYVIDCPDVQTFISEVSKLSGKKIAVDNNNNDGTLF